MELKGILFYCILSGQGLSTAEQYQLLYASLQVGKLEAMAFVVLESLV